MEMNEAEDFQVVGIWEEKESVEEKRESKRKEILYKFAQNKGSVIAVVTILVIIIFALLGPLLVPYSNEEIFMDKKNLPPRIPVLEKLGIFDGSQNGVNLYESKGLQDEYHFFGTDAMGRDLWVRTCYGTRISLYVAVIAVLIDAILGITIGLLCGYYGGFFDLIVQRVIEVISGIPNLVVVTLLLMVLKPGLFTITLALLMTSWIGMSRVVRAEVLQIKEQEYILASKTLGTPLRKILFREILPNAVGQVIIMVMLSVPSAIFLESFLSFIGLGIPMPLASLGSLISTGFNNMLLYPYQVTIPVVVFSILLVGFNLVADGLRDALDIKQS